MIPKVIVTKIWEQLETGENLDKPGHMRRVGRVWWEVLSTLITEVPELFSKIDFVDWSKAVVWGKKEAGSYDSFDFREHLVKNRVTSINIF